MLEIEWRKMFARIYFVVFSFNSLHFLKDFLYFQLHILYVEKYHSLLAIFFHYDPSAVWCMARNFSRSLAWFASSNPQGIWISPSCDCCVLCRYRNSDWPILLPAEFYRVCVCVCVCVCACVHAFECASLPTTVIVITLYTCSE
jgi:hypothetical protein